MLDKPVSNKFLTEWEYYYLLLSDREYDWLKRIGFLTDWLTELNDWLTKIGFCHDESINSIYDHKKTQRNADVSSVSPSSKFSLRPRLQGSAQIFERTKTCTDPPFVYTGPAEPCTKLLNGKVCKFLTWSEVGQKFLTGSTFFPASRGLYSKNQGKDTSARRESIQFTRTSCKHLNDASICTVCAVKARNKVTRL